MPKRSCKSKYVRLKNGSVDSVFKQMHYHIHHRTKEKDLIRMLGQCTDEVIQKTWNGFYLLHHACESRGEYDRFTLDLYKRFPDPIYKNKNWSNRNPLQIAIKLGDYNIINSLIHGFSSYLIYEHDWNGETALFYAIKFKRESVVQFLLSKNETKIVNHQNKNGKTAFHFICENPRDNDILIQLFLHDNTINFKLKEKYHDDSTAGTAFDRYFLYLSSNEHPEYEPNDGIIQHL